MVEQAKRNARKWPGAAAGLSGSGSGTFFVLQSRRVAWQIDAPHIRRKGEGRLRLSHGGATRGSPRAYAAGSFSSGDSSFSTSVSTATLRCVQSAVPRRPKLPSGNHRIIQHAGDSDNGSEEGHQAAQAL